MGTVPQSDSSNLEDVHMQVDARTGKGPGEHICSRLISSIPTRVIPSLANLRTKGLRNRT